jgi:hypothetical protein
MKLNEIADDIPLIIVLLKQRQDKGETVYLPLGKLRYYLRRVVYVPPADWADGDYWDLSFSVRVGARVTHRRITKKAADTWHLEKEINDGYTEWKMTQDASDIWK